MKRFCKWWNDLTSDETILQVMRWNDFYKRWNDFTSDETILQVMKRFYKWWNDFTSDEMKRFYKRWDYFTSYETILQVILGRVPDTYIWPILLATDISAV